MTRREPHRGLPSQARPDRTDNILSLDGPGVPAPLALAAQLFAAEERKDRKAAVQLRRELRGLGYRLDRIIGPPPGSGGGE